MDRFAARHLGLVHAERVRGDRAENLALSAELLRAALAEAPAGEDPELHALIRTNLAMALMRGELGERRAVLREAVELCGSALEYRSLERDAVNWAYSQLNLGEAVEALAALDGGSRARPSTHISGSRMRRGGFPSRGLSAGRITLSGACARARQR